MGMSTCIAGAHHQELLAIKLLWIDSRSVKLILLWETVRPPAIIMVKEGGS